MRILCFILFSIILFTSSTVYVWAKIRPVIIVPGIMGSKLCDANNAVIWGDRYSYSFSRLNLLRLPPDPAMRDKSIRSCGLIDSVNVVPLFWESHVYSGLKSFLASEGYSENDIFEFDYDWRLSNFENAGKLSNFINKVSMGSKVDIIAHSMGGLIARIYYQTLGGSNLTHSLIMLGTPHLGSAKILKIMENGFEYWPNVLSGGISEVQQTILSFPSTYQLLPGYSECCGFSKVADPTSADYFDILQAGSWKRLNIPHQFKTGSYEPALNIHLNEAAKLKLLLSQPISYKPDELARIHYVGNAFIPTWSRVYFDPDTGQMTGNTLSPGDGSVLLFSATNGNPAQVQISHREHEAVFLGKGPQLVILAAITDRIWHNGGAAFTQTIIDAQSREFVSKSGSINIQPQFAEAGMKISLSLKFVFEKEVSEADFSNIKANLVSSEKLQTAIPLEATASSQREKAFSAIITAPASPGAYTIRVSAAGLEPIEAHFAVFGK